MNHKRLRRVYRAEGLRLRKARRRKPVSVARVPRPVPDGPNTPWTIDFISDAVATGRRFRTLSVVDECTRGCLALRVDVALPSSTVARVLDELAQARGAPQRVSLDNGPEMIARALDPWAYARGVELAFTRRGKPVDNCDVERFHDKFRDACLSLHWFLDLSDARHLIAAWREDYNPIRPHQGLRHRTPAAFAVLCAQPVGLESARTTQPP